MKKKDYYRLVFFYLSIFLVMIGYMMPITDPPKAQNMTKVKVVIYGL